MDDIQIKTHIQQSEANGKYQQIEDIKRQRANLKEQQDKLEGELIHHIRNNGSVLAFKNDTPYVLTAGNVSITKLDKKQLAEDLGIPQKDLSAEGIAELVEEKRLTSEMIRSAMFTETDTRLKARKAKKSDLELIFGGRG